MRDHLDKVHGQMAVLNSTQMILASQASYIHCFQNQFIEEAKRVAKTGEDWRSLVRRPAGRPPLLIDRESLDFLLDKRFLKKAPGYENIYIEITEASARFEIVFNLIELFCNAKASLESVASVLPDGKGLDESHRTIEFDSRGLRFAFEIKSSLDDFDKVSEETVKELLGAFDRIDGLFLARWRKASGIARKDLQPVTQAALDPRVAYGNRYR
ncbi:MAG: hypothetical protein QXD86_05700 [Candidatus Bathyarchaeia archaeon]